MVVSDYYRYVYVPILKTGSQAVCHWLCRNYRGQHVLTYHEMEVPDCYRDYLVWTIVRNPYERCFSWWWMDAKEPRENINRDVWGLSFVEFMRQQIERKQDSRWRFEPEKPNFSMTQQRIVLVSGAQRIVKYEFMQEGLAALPFIKKLKWPIEPRNQSNTKPKKSFHDYFAGDDQPEQIVWDYCREDFEAFAYARKQA